MLWAREPRAGEQFALFVMLAAQAGAAALLFPLLLQNIRSTILAVAAAWPLAQLAAFLADAQMNQWMAGELYVSIWLVTLHLWARAMQNQNSWTRLLAAAVAAMLSLGGPLLWYLRNEFGEGGQAQAQRFPAFGPIAGAISQIVPDLPIKSAWLALALLFASGVIACMVKLLHPANSRDKLST
jgi:hypothetical protein